MSGFIENISLSLSKVVKSGGAMGILDTYNYLFNDLADKSLDDLPLIHSPFPILIITAAYLMFVFKWGPQFMENRKPFNLNKILILYNVFQMIACGTLVVATVPHMNLRQWYCNPVSSAQVESPVIKYSIYGYFMLKLCDLLDTVFIMLKKNNRQITTLHIYHHSSMTIIIWIACKYIPYGHSIYTPVLNSFVHMVMYGYYLLTVYNQKYKKSIWWKKHITHLQLFQFGLAFIVYGAPILNGCDTYPSGVLYFIVTLDFILTALFSNFYYQTYIRKKTK